MVPEIAATGNDRLTLTLREAGLDVTLLPNPPTIMVMARPRNSLYPKSLIRTKPTLAG